MRVTVVIPCFNEEHRLDLEACATATLPDGELRLLFVDDGSTDRTAAVLQEFCETAPRHRLLRLDRNSGKAEAVRRGVLAARDDAPDAVGYWDADMATPLDELPRFVQLLHDEPELKLVMGSRVKILGAQIERQPHRQLLGRAFATAVSNLLRLDVYDTQCGAKLLRSDADLEALFGEPFGTDWIFDVELIARLLRRWPQGRPEGLLRELPLRRWRDVRGSKLGPLDGPRALLDLLHIARMHGPFLWGR